MVEKNEEKKKRPYTPPTITAVTYNPRDKVMTGVQCDTGSGTDEIGLCDTFLDCEGL